jgi:hypothetical protein
MAWGVIDIPIVCALNIHNMPLWGMWTLWFVSFGLSILFTNTLISMFAVDSKNKWTVPWATLDSELKAKK